MNLVMEFSARGSELEMHHYHANMCSHKPQKLPYTMVIFDIQIDLTCVI
jgi:hypothetical protein